MQKQLENEIKVGIFVSVGVGLIMIAILVLGANQSLFTSRTQYTSHFQNVEGLIVGAKVILAGVPVGIVDDIRFDAKTKNVEVVFSVAKNSKEWIHKNASLEIATQGVLGDKYISLDGGDPNDPTLPEGSDIPPHDSKDLSQILNKGDQLMLTLNGIVSTLDRILKGFEADHRSEIFFKGLAQTAKNLSQATEKVNSEFDQIKLKNTLLQINQIFEKINNGTGTVGALINDPSLYDELKALLGGANRNRVIRNLVRQTVKDSQSKDSVEK